MAHGEEKKVQSDQPVKFTERKFRVGLKVVTMFALLGVAALIIGGVSEESPISTTDVAVRSHNLDVFYKSLTCDDLPLSSDMNVAACEQAIGEYTLPEAGLFTR